MEKDERNGKSCACRRSSLPKKDIGTRKNPGRRQTKTFNLLATKRCKQYKD
jgi:hypothetical protein